MLALDVAVPGCMLGTKYFFPNNTRSHFRAQSKSELWAPPSITKNTNLKKIKIATLFSRDTILIASKKLEVWFWCYNSK